MYAACEASGESESTSTDSIQIVTCCRPQFNNFRHTCAANQVLSSPTSTSSDETSNECQPLSQTNDATTKLMSTATLQIVSASDLPLTNHKLNTICSDSHKIVPLRPQMPIRNTNRIDFQLLENNNYACNNIPSDKCQLNPKIRYAFYNKGFEVTSINRKFSLVKHELRSTTFGMPNIDEYVGSPEDNNDSDNYNKWTTNRSADAIHLFNLTKTQYGGSSGRDITLLPRLKIRISDEMGKRVKSSFDESTSSDENEFGKSFEKRFAANNSNDSLCMHSTTDAIVDDIAAFDPFQYEVIQSKENFRKCQKCGHHARTLCKQFSNSFQFD